MADTIKFIRQPDGTYVRSGELPPGTRWAVVRSSAGAGLGVSKRVNEWLRILEAGPLKQDWYELIPDEAPHRMTKEAKEKLALLNQQRKDEQKVRE